MTKAPLLPSDLSRLRLPSDPQAGPDGRVFYVLTTYDEPADETCTAIHAVRPGEEPAAFTSGRKDRKPRVAPDGTWLAFVAERGDGVRIYVAPLGGGEAAPLGPAYDAISALAWAPDGQRLAFVAKTALEPESARIAVDERSGARHIRGLPFKSDDAGLLDGRREHLHTIALANAAVTRVTTGDFDVEAPAWSPDGSRIAFVASIGTPEASFISDVFAVAATGGEPVRLTRGRGIAMDPAWSPDGARVAYVGHERGDDAGGRLDLEPMIVATAGGEPSSVAAGIGRAVSDFVIADTRIGSPMPPFWRGGDEIVVPVSDAGTCGLVAFAADGSGYRRILGGEREIVGRAPLPGGGFVVVASEPTVPARVIACPASGPEVVLVDPSAWLAERAIRVPRRIRPAASDGTALDLWLIDPPGEGPRPWVLEVHGGPHAAYGFAFFFEFQMLAGLGIGVAYGNPRGSQSYGEAYADAITGDWGGLDANDVMTLADAALANAEIDPKRFAIAGGSYGGYMTTLLLGRTDRFAAGISMRAVNDMVSEVGTADLGWFLEREIGASLLRGEDRAVFEASPMRGAAKIAAPLLVEHSERDFRCPIDQGDGLFTLLRRLGRTSTEYVRFTGDGHNLSRSGKPRNRMLRLRAIAHWLIRHLRPAGSDPVAERAGALFAPLLGEPAETREGKRVPATPADGPGSGRLR